MKNYFPHDEGARNDPKLIKVLMKLGQAGKGVYWDLVEMLYEQGGYLLLSECDSYAFALRTDCAFIKTLVNDFDLFETDGEKFWSNSALRRLKVREEKSKKAAESASKRWNNANAMRTHSDGNAIKESKLKESKEKEIKVNNTKEGLAVPPPPGEDLTEEIEEIKSLALAEKKATHTGGAGREPETELIFPFNSPDFRHMWDRWNKHRKSLRKPFKSLESEQQALKQLSAYDETFAIKLIEKSIASGYQGLVYDRTDEDYQRYLKTQNGTNRQNYNGGFDTEEAVKIARMLATKRSEPAR